MAARTPNTPDDAEVPPDHPDYLHAPQGWTWDELSVQTGEYVTFPLYLRLRQRLCELRLPDETHNLLIQELIDTHDDSLMDHGTARSTLVVHAGGALDVVSILGADECGGLDGT